MSWMKSIRGRLALVLSAAIIVFWCISAAISAVIFSSELGESFDSALQETAQRLIPLALDDVGEYEDEDGRSLGHETERHEEYIVYQLVGRNGRLLLRSHDAPTRVLTTDLREGFGETGGLRTYVIRDRESGSALIVAEELSHRREALMESVVALVVPLVGLVPLSALLIVVLVRKQLRPLEALKAQIAQRGRENLSPVTGMFPSELAPIAAATNELMQRLKTALDAERAFAANSAHELRTPVAAALAQLQMLKREMKGVSALQRADAVEDALKRLSRLSEKLLQLSRADAGIGISSAPADVLPVIRIVIADRALAHKGAQIEFDAGGCSGMVSTIDGDALAIVLGNLLDNALVHGDKSKPVEIRLTPQGSLHVRNAGAVIAPERLAEVRNRFARDSARPGSGLGLAIADTIMMQSGGGLELVSPAPGHTDGVEAVIRLPVARAA